MSFLDAQTLSAATLLFLVMDPLGNVPVFLSILKDIDDKTRRLIILRELAVALVILSIFLAFGQQILDLLGLQTESVRIAGGVILFIIALRMIFPSEEGVMGSTGDSDPFIVPLAIPLLAGPSTLATLIVMSSSEQSWLSQGTSLLMAWSACAAILLLSPALYKLLRNKGLAAMERLMGMILVMIAVQMLIDGLESLGIIAKSAGF